MNKESLIYVAGHRGLVGSAIAEALRHKGYTNIIVRSHAELDLVNQQAVDDFFAKNKPEYVFLAAAKVGGIVANNTLRAQFIYENIQVQNNVIHACYVHGVKKLLFLGSSCIYPRMAPQPLKESYLLTDELEYTNEPYAIAKIAGIRMCESYNLQYGTNFLSVMPTNLYGINDNFHLDYAHVLPAMMRKMHLAHCIETGNFKALRSDLAKRPVKNISLETNDDEIANGLKFYGIHKSNGRVSLSLWGTGNPLREFLWAGDMADACVFIMENINDPGRSHNNETPNRNHHINIGTGKEVTIRQLSEFIKQATGFGGDILFDSTKPDGTPRKLLDVSKLADMGWTYKVELEDGIKRMYENYLLG